MCAEKAFIGKANMEHSLDMTASEDCPMGAGMATKVGGHWR